MGQCNKFQSKEVLRNFGLVEALVCWRLEELFSICIIAFAEGSNLLVLERLKSALHLSAHSCFVLYFIPCFQMIIWRFLFQHTCSDQCSSFPSPRTIEHSFYKQNSYSLCFIPYCLKHFNLLHDYQKHTKTYIVVLQHVWHRNLNLIVDPDYEFGKKTTPVKMASDLSNKLIDQYHP